MILVDANLLVYAFVTSTPEHAHAKEWLDGELAGSQRVALGWESLTAFARLVTNPRMFTSPASLNTAWAQIERWITQPTVWIPVATPQHASIMGELFAGERLVANDVPDIHLASLAISHGLKLATHDAGFARFEGLRWFDPLSR